GLAFGFGLSLFQPWTAVAVALGSSLLLATAAMGLCWQAHIWCPWLIHCFVQVPCALVCALFAARRQRGCETGADLVLPRASLQGPAGEQKELLLHKASERARILGLSTEQLQSPQLKEAVIVRFPGG